MDKALLHTPLHTLHLQHEARMVPFAGYDMPVQYPAGIKQEHLHTRDAAGLFDVSHMGQIRLSDAENGALSAQALEQLVPVDIIDLPAGKQRYALFTADNGGILDDLMVTRYDDCLYLVVNAACKDADIAHLRSNLPDEVQLDVLDDRALLALQGPKAIDVMQALEPSLAQMTFMDSRRITLDGIDVFISRSGYTGEDGFEISVPANSATHLAERLLEFEAVWLIGLGARDSLRLEAGLCLYGHDITTDTTPVEAGLTWAISKVRRLEGARAGGFPGADVFLPLIGDKQALKRKRVGLIGTTRAPVREGTRLTNTSGETIGQVCSGGFAPSVEKPVAMAYLDLPYTALDTEVYASVRGKQLPMKVSRMPFVSPRYYRG